MYLDTSPLEQFRIVDPWSPSRAAQESPEALSQCMLEASSPLFRDPPDVPEHAWKQAWDHHKLVCSLEDFSQSDWDRVAVSFDNLLSLTAL